MTRRLCIGCMLFALCGLAYFRLKVFPLKTPRGPARNSDDPYGDTSPLATQEDAAVITRTLGSGSCDSALSKRLKRVRERVASMESDIALTQKELGVDGAMMKRALAHKTSFDRLRIAFKDVLLTRRPLVVGLVGGSISVGTAIMGEEYLFANRTLRVLEDILGSPVILQNGALGGTTSFYHTLCMEAHLDLTELDVMLWECAANDYYGSIGPESLEEFTRSVMALPNQPQLIYVNFQYGKHVLEKNCVNNEQCCSNPLSRYYDIPAINMPDAVCELIQTDRALDLVAPDNAHPSRKAHAMMSIFLVQLLKDVLLEAVEDTLETLSCDFDRSQWRVEESDFHRTPPEPLYNETRITHPQCWSTTRSPSGNKNELIPFEKGEWNLTSENWGRGRLDKKTFWLSQPNSVIKFQFDVTPYKHLTSNLIVVTMGCEECGFALLTVDEDRLFCINTQYKYHTCKLHLVMSGLSPGRHTLSVLSNEAPVRFVAIVSSYDDAQLTSQVYAPVFPHCVIESKRVSRPKECWSAQF